MISSGIMQRIEVVLQQQLAQCGKSQYFVQKFNFFALKVPKFEIPLGDQKVWNISNYKREQRLKILKI